MNQRVSNPPEPEAPPDGYNLESTTGESTELVVSPSVTADVKYILPNELPDLEAADEGISLNPKYIEFTEVGQTFRGVYLDMRKSETIGRNGEPLVFCIFQNRDGVFLNSGEQLKRTCANIPHGTPVSITYAGKEKTKSGNEVKIYDVRLLIVPKQNDFDTP